MSELINGFYNIRTDGSYDNSVSYTTSTNSTDWGYFVLREPVQRYTYDNYVYEWDIMKAIKKTLNKNVRVI